MFDPIEKEIINKLNKYFKNIKYIKSPMFLNSQEDNILINTKYKNIKHDKFYKLQRIKHYILIDKNNNPIFNKWSFDKYNREKFPKNTDEPLNYKVEKNNKYINEAKLYIDKYFNNNYGNYNIFIYPINRKKSLKWLNSFIKSKLSLFGKYEDAFDKNIIFGYHSCLSALLNIGLLTPNDIINKIIKLKINEDNISSIEGFIRQIIGWREYCYYIYILYSDNLKNNFYFNKNNNIINQNIWNNNNNIEYIDNILEKVNNYAYCHHIERLMCISNYFNLSLINPKEIYNWFMTMFIDSYEVFMIPNVYGMALYGYIYDNKHMMKKPYICSSNYILKYSNYKKNEWCEKINELYHNFLKLYNIKNYGY